MSRNHIAEVDHNNLSSDEMDLRALTVLIVAIPALMVGGAMAMGLIIPVPEVGRDYVQRVDWPDQEQALSLPDVAGPDDPDRPLVVIDAGHGGRDPGAIGAGVQEKDITLAISLALRDELVRDGGVRVAMTREDDRFIVLAERPEIARRLEADLFISIHADSAGELSQVSGATIYTLSNEASSEAAARFAARENAVDRLNGVLVESENDAVNAILVELSQQVTQDAATEFANLIQREGMGQIRFHPETKRSAALAVLRAPDVPAVLFESGFVTNQGDRARLTTEAGRAVYARVLSQAIRVFFARRVET